LLTSARGEKLLKIRKTPRSQVLAPQGPRKGEDEHTHRHTLKAYVEENRTGSGFTYAEKEGVEGGEERRNGGRVIGGRGKMGRSTVGGESGRMIRRRGTGRAWADGFGVLVCCLFVRSFSHFLFLRHRIICWPGPLPKG